MSTMAKTIDERDALGLARAPAGASRVIAMLAAVAAGAIGIAGAADRTGRLSWTAAVLVCAWAVAALVIAIAKRSESFALWVAVAALAGGAALMTEEFVGLVPYTLALVAIT